MIWMDLQKMANSRIGVHLGRLLGRMLPLRPGYGIAGYLAGRLAAFKNAPMIRAVQANQSVVRGGELTVEERHRAAVDVFTHAGRCFIDLYHNLHSSADLGRIFPESDELNRLITLSQDKKFGALIVAPHLSNFDLCLLSASYRGFKTQVLVYGRPTGGYRIQNDIRGAAGLDITPIGRTTLKKTLENLRSGGFVTTAIDRPLLRKSQRVNFFGRPSPLPVGHVRMALEADVPVIVLAVHMDSKGLYRIEYSEPIRMRHFGNHRKEIHYNAEMILERIEHFVRKYSEQWLMYYPVWPG